MLLESEALSDAKIKAYGKQLTKLRLMYRERAAAMANLKIEEEKDAVAESVRKFAARM